MPDPKKPSLDLLKVKKEPALVDEVEVVVRTSTMAQQGMLVDSIGKFDPTPLFESVSPIFEAATSGEGWGTAVTQHGGKAWLQIIGFLKTTATDVLANAAAVLLDNAENYANLTRAGQPLHGTAERQPDGSEDLRTWVKNNITLEQAVHVVRTAINLNGYAAMGKALLALFKAQETLKPGPLTQDRASESEPQEKTTPTIQ